MITGRTLLATAITLVAFASNSVLCRLALAGEHIDPVSFTGIRLASGAVMLALVMGVRGPGTAVLGAGSWRSAGALFVYAIAFSWAYVTLPAGTGALILFGAVQITMIGTALFEGDRPRAREWTGLVAALAGLIYLVSPGLAAPAPAGAALMAMAGVAWGVYSLGGRKVTRALADTAGNFLRTVPVVLVLLLLALPSLALSPAGVALAILSGAVASGLGYVIWYAALGGLTATQASAVQLAVPVLAGLGGVLLLSERLSLRLVLAGALILGGIALALSTRAAQR